MAVETAARSASPEGSTQAVTDSGGRTITYATFGAASKRPLLVFHGTPGSRLVGGLFRRAAREHGVQVVAIDRPGFGESDSRPSFSPADVGTLVAPVLEAIDATEAGVLGFSGGSSYALALAAERPDLVHAVDIVSGATPPAFGATPRQMRLLAGMARRTPRLLGAVLRGQCWLASRTPSAVVRQYTDPETVPEPVVELVAADFREAMATTRSGAVREFGRVGVEWPIALPTIDQPVRLWHGARDANVPVDGARRLTDALPTGSLTVVEGVDHLQTLLETREMVVRKHA